MTGSTAPLWTALLALLFLLPGSVVVWTKLLGVALHLAGDRRHLAPRPASSASRRGLAALAAVLTLATSWLVWSALSGMEIPLFIFLSLQGMILHLRERADPGRPPLSLGVLAVAVAGAAGRARPARPRLRRPPAGLRAGAPRDEDDDSALAAAGLRARSSPASRSPPARWPGPSSSTAGRAARFLPTTFAAKGGASCATSCPTSSTLNLVFTILFRPQPYMALLAGAGVLALVERLGTPRDRGLLPALWLLAVPLAYSLVTPRPDERCWRATSGATTSRSFRCWRSSASSVCERAAEAARARLQPAASDCRWEPCSSLSSPGPPSAAWSRGRAATSRTSPTCRTATWQIARWLAPRLPPDAVLAVNDIGALKFLLPNRVIDLAGIANPEIRRAMDGGRRPRRPAEQTMFDEIERRKPDYLVIFPAWFPTSRRPPFFRPLCTLDIQDNITMGGPQVVLYATPWNRYPLHPGPECGELSIGK